MGIVENAILGGWMEDRYGGWIEERRRRRREEEAEEDGVSERPFMVKIAPSRN